MAVMAKGNDASKKDQSVSENKKNSNNNDNRQHENYYSKATQHIETFSIQVPHISK
jgi:hypothetical protein